MTTPTCPYCKAKFSHDNLLSVCKKCGLPDELAEDPHLVNAWRLGLLRQTRKQRTESRQSKSSRQKPAKAPTALYRRLSVEKRHAT